MNALVEEIKAYCLEHAKEEIVRKYSRYFKEGHDAYGLTFEEIESKVNEIVAREEVKFETILAASRILVQGSKYEETSFTLMLTRAYKKEFSRETFSEINDWFMTGINNWAHTDFMASELIFEFFKRNLITYQDLEPWMRAQNKFQRRVVPVSLIKLLKTTTEFEPYFLFLESIMLDKERVVHQGLGWFLREAWKIQPGPTEAFLLKWKDSAPRLIFQYATEKMNSDQKLRFRRVK